MPQYITNMSGAPFPKAINVLPAVLGGNFSLSDSIVSGDTKKLSTVLASNAIRYASHSAIMTHADIAPSCTVQMTYN